MGRAKFTSHQIIKAIREVEAGKKVAIVCQELGVSNATFYNWRNHKDNYMDQLKMQSADKQLVRDLTEENN